MYFSKLPYKIFDIQGTNFLLTDILTRIIPSKALKENLTLYEKYSVKDGETPEMVANNFYGNTEYHWILLLINDITKPLDQWVLPYGVLSDYVVSKYGLANIYDVHHYYDSDGYAVNQEDSVGSVTNLEYETEQNEIRRDIRILNPLLVSTFIKEFDKLVKGQ